MDLSFYKGKKVLVTGHTGFKGTWLCRILINAGAQVTGYSLNPPTEPNLFSMADVESRMNSVIGDIRDLDHLKKVFEQTQPEIVLHLAAQPIVRDSYKDPVYTYETNVMGTVNICECVRLNPCVKSFLNVTTDKVYKNNEWEWGYRENEPLDGFDPYSNSKSCSELVTHSYINSFFDNMNLAVSTARAGNVIGGGDFANDRIVPDCVRAAIEGKDIIVRNPHSTRPYQHVLEPLAAYLIIAQKQFEDKKYAGFYNVGPDETDCVTTGNLVDTFCAKWGEGIKWIDRYDGGPHEANFLKLDCSKLKTTFGWKPRWNFDTAIEKSVEWSKVYATGGDVVACMDKEIEEFFNYEEAMFENKNESQAREDILSMVDEYCKKYHNNKEYKEGDRIPYASRVYDSKEMMNLVDSALEFWLTSGRYTEQFEKQLGEYLNVKYVSVVNSGSSANLNAFMALTSPLLGDRRIKRGDEIITVAAGFPTTITPAIQYGAVPVFVDVTIPQYNIDVTKLEGALSDKTKAVMIAHTLGNPFDLGAVKEFCDKHNLWLVEDNCDALGSKYTINGEEKFTGTIGDIGTSSFYPPHHMTMGEGGAVYTNNPLLNKCIRSFRDWGRDCVCPSGVDNMCGHRFDRQYGELPLGYDHKYVYSHFGYNLKATDMQAAVGCAQLEKFPSFVERRRHNFDRLKAALEEVADKIILPEACANSRPSWFGFLITVREGIDRKQVVKYIEDHGVQTRNLFAGNIIKHPCFDEMRASGEGFRVYGGLEVTDRIMNDTFWVGVYPGMTDEMIDFMAKTIKEAVNQ